MSFTANIVITNTMTNNTLTIHTTRLHDFGAPNGEPACTQSIPCGLWISSVSRGERKVSPGLANALDVERPGERECNVES